MNIKSVCIKINDALTYIVLVFVLITSAIVCATTGVLQGLAVGGIGLVVCSMLFGMWFCLSQTAINSQRQADMLEKLVKLSEKVN